jgi:DNA-binding beta-propeller fold protein YncE
MAFCKYRWRHLLSQSAFSEEIYTIEGLWWSYTCRPMKKTAFFCVLVGCFVMKIASVHVEAESNNEKTAQPMLLVANQGDHNLSLIDPSAGKQVATIPVEGVTGHEVAASPDGKTAYVPIYGDSGVGRPGTDGTKISVIDLASRKVVHTIDFGHGVRPHCAIYDRNSGMLYVTTELDKSVSIIDPKTLKIVGSVPTGQEQSHMLVLTRDGSRGYTANVGPGTVSVLDMKGRKTLAIIPISKDTQRISISRDDSMVFRADQTKPQLAVIDTATNKVKMWVPLPSVAYGTAVTLDGRWLLVTLRTGKQVAVVDLKTMKVAQTIEVADGPTEILMSPDGKTAFVSCTRSNQIAAIDLAQWKVARLIDAGKTADGLAWAK